VNNCHSVPFASMRKPSINTTKIGKCLADRLVLKSKHVCDGDCRGGIQRVMPAWHRQSEVADRVRDFHSTIPEENRKPRLPVDMVEIGEPYVSLWVFAVSWDVPILRLVDQVLTTRSMCS